MRELVPFLLGLLGAGLGMLVWREQFRADANRRDQFTDDALQRDWRFTTTLTGRGYYDADVKVVPDLAAIEGGLARFAARVRVARAFKKHFGEALPLGGRDVRRVDVDGIPSDRFVVFSDQADEAARRLTPALLSSIRQVWSVWADLGVMQPWVGLCGDRIAIACVQQRPADATHVAALVEIGSTLAARG